MPIIGIIASADKNVPNAPTIGTATDVGTGRAFTPQNGGGTVTFTAPTFTGNSPIIDYTATSSPSGFTATGAGSPLTVNGLAPNTNYTFTVTARNAIGNSAASAASNTMLATTVPQAPTIGTATDGGTGTTVSVAFTGNATGGKAISTYTATSSPGGLTGTGASSPITVSGLTAGTAYTFTVTATNANGTSSASSPSNSVTPEVPASYDSIATYIGNDTASTITFTSIPQTYKVLIVRISMVSTSSGVVTAQPNADTGSNIQGIYYGTATQSAYNSFYSGTTNAMYVAGYNRPSNNVNPTVGEFFCVDYTTSKTKAFYSQMGLDTTQQTNGSEVYISGNVYNSTAAITSMRLFSGNNFATGTSIALYGLK